MKGAFRRAAARYQEWRPLYYYAKGKLALDPAYPAAVALLKDSPHALMDVGCGMGLLAACLRESGHRARIVGVDVDEGKISVAGKVLGREDADFQALDALDFPSHTGDVVMLDVLHYFSDEDQQRLLQKIAASIAPGGVAVIRMAVKEDNWRFAATRMEEWVVRLTNWIANPGWNFPEREAVIGPFHEVGFEVECRPMWGLTPFNSYLFVCRRKSQRVQGV